MPIDDLTLELQEINADLEPFEFAQRVYAAGRLALGRGQDLNSVLNACCGAVELRCQVATGVYLRGGLYDIKLAVQNLLLAAQESA